MIVASSVDPGTERIVQYLADEYDVEINVVFFRVFSDEGREYLTRAFLREPGTADVVKSDGSSKGEWNGEYYVSFGHSPKRQWSDAVKYGFICGGCGLFYSRTLKLLEPGARVWVNCPGKGYVGVGEVVDEAVRVDQFTVQQNGKSVPITDAPVDAPEMFHDIDDDELAEWLVRVNWIKTVSFENAIKEKGFFGNQNTVAAPRVPKWVHTVDRLKTRFGIPSIE